MPDLARRAALSLALAAVAVACARPERESRDLAPSMKGWELYSWQSGGEWRFALHEGTNRDKQFEDIRRGGVQLHGVEELLAAFERLPTGDFVFWCSPGAQGLATTLDLFPLPPDEIVERVVERAGQLELSLSIPHA